MGCWGSQVTHKYANVHNSPILNVFTQPLNQEIPRESCSILPVWTQA